MPDIYIKIHRMLNLVKPFLRRSARRLGAFRLAQRLKKCLARARYLEALEKIFRGREINAALLKHARWN